MSHLSIHQELPPLPDSLTHLRVNVPEHYQAPQAQSSTYHGSSFSGIESSTRGHRPIPTHVDTPRYRPSSLPYYSSWNEPPGQFGVPFQEAAFPFIPPYQIPHEVHSQGPRLQVPSGGLLLPHNRASASRSQPYTPALSMPPRQPATSYRRQRMQEYSTSMANRSGMQTTAEEQNTPAPTPYWYIAPWEYSQRVDTEFEYDNLEDYMYARLDDDQTRLIVDRIKEIRPYRDDAIKKKLINHMRVPEAKALMSDDTREVEKAVNELYPIDMKKRRSTHDPWMTGLTNEQRRQVMAKLADATQQPVDTLLDFFLKQKITPGVAWAILQAASKEEVVALARNLNLLVTEERAQSKWQKGMGQLQRRALLYRMKTTGKVIDDARSYKMLQKRFVPSAFGLKMLRANDEDFVKMVLWLKGRGLDPLSLQ
ncbi:hypothetical protein CBS101457_000213 [Exobasidium rhododendri]|nr:hypothetical protein CBS101457_000213 [Exobasidium rhododendri]